MRYVGFFMILSFFSTHSFADNIFLSQEMKTAVCNELISEMVEDDVTYGQYMGICLDAEKTQFCTPSVQPETSSVGTRHFIQYNLVDFQPDQDMEDTTYTVKAYPDSGLFLRKKAEHLSCD